MSHMPPAVAGSLAWNGRPDSIQHRHRASACLSGLKQGLKAPHIKMDRKVCLGHKGDPLVLDEGAGMLK